MGKTGSIITSVIVVLCIGIGGFLLDQQKHYIMEPFEDYLKFNQFVRDTTDLNYYLQSIKVFTEGDKWERIDNQLNGTNITRTNITDYYIEKIKTSINHQDTEEFMKGDRFRSVYHSLDSDKVFDLFNQLNYNFTQIDSISQVSVASKLFTTSQQQAIALSVADNHSFDIFVDEISSQSYQQYIVAALVFSILFLLIFQCTFIPITQDVYKSRNKKSRRVEARMSQNTLFIHLGLHVLTTLVMIVFIILFYNTANDFYDKTSRNSFDLLKYTKKYYFTLRILQADDMVNIQDITDQTPVIVNTIYKQQFTDANKDLQNSMKLKIKFTELKDLLYKYLYNSDCNIQLIYEDQLSKHLCETTTEERLKLTYQPSKKANSLESIRYKDMYDENLIFDHFQVEYCHDVIRNIKEVMEDYISTIQETVLLFLFQFSVCIGFLLIFWVPFFKDKSSYKKDARRFEMVNQI